MKSASAAGLLVIAAGVYLLVARRHPRFLARIKPTQLALWSFAVATAHGAGLMLLPIYLGICAAGEQDAGHQAAAALMRGNLGTAIAVSIVHATAMIVSGGIVAFAVYEWLGLRFISKSWFNLDVVWALSLIFVGAIGVTSAAASALRQQSIESARMVLSHSQASCSVVIRSLALPALETPCSRAIDPLCHGVGASPA